MFWVLWDVLLFLSALNWTGKGVVGSSSYCIGAVVCCRAERREVQLTTNNGLKDLLFPY